MQPFVVQIFVLYLISAGMVVLVRLVRLALVLHPIVKIGEVSLKSICAGQISPDQLTESALAGRLPEVPEGNGNPEIAARPPYESSVRRTLYIAEYKFNYLHSGWCAKAIVTREFAPLTVILALLVFVLNLSDVLRGAWTLASPAESGTALLHKNLVLAFQPLALALFFGAIVYTLSNMQESALKWRMTKWQYFRARIGSELS